MNVDLSILIKLKVMLGFVYRHAFIWDLNSMLQIGVLCDKKLQIMIDDMVCCVTLWDLNKNTFLHRQLSMIYQ